MAREVNEVNLKKELCFGNFKHMDIYKLIDIEFINRIEKFYPAFIDLVIKYREEQGKEKITKKDFLRKDVFLFEPESQIIRYLRDMIRQNKERFLEESGKDCVLVNYLKPNERISLFSEANRDYLLFHLIRNNIISGIHFPGKTGMIKDLESGEKISYRPKTAFKIINIRKVKELLESLERSKNNYIDKGKFKKNKISKEIKSITIVEPNDPDEDKHKLVINNKYLEAKSVWPKKWQILKDIIQGKDIKFDKSFADYINCNNRCILYQKDKYKLTKILEKDFHGNFKIASGVEVKVISEVAYKKRIKKELRT